MIKKDLISKLVDGLASAVVLLLLLGLLRFLENPFAQVLGRPGVLAYTFIILAASIFCLERSSVTRISETTCTWYGMLGRVLAWVVTKLSGEMGTAGISGLSSLILLIMVSLITATLWLRVLPIGVRFYFLIFILNWIVSLLLLGVETWSIRIPFITIIWRVSGYLGILGGLVTLGWMFYFSEKRIQRLWYGLWVWFCLDLAAHVFVVNLIN